MELLCIPQNYNFYICVEDMNLYPYELYPVNWL